METTGDGLIIFVKNPVRGRVKTRLAARIGDDKALEVYRALLQKTHDITDELPVRKFVFYDQYVERKDIWDTPSYQKRVQKGENLGVRMLNAQQEVFSEGLEKVCIIGSDCYELNPSIVKTAYQRLDDNDLVVGPAHDGGYYLIGMKKSYGRLFQDKPWSCNNLLEKTLEDARLLKIKYFLLPTLRDIDDYDDLVQSDVRI